MDADRVDSLRILKKFFDDVHRKLPRAMEETLLCLSLDHVLSLFSGLALLYDFEHQPFDAESVTDVDQSKFYYELRCLLNYASMIRHLKLVPGADSSVASKDQADLGDLAGLRTLEVKAIPHDSFRGLEVVSDGLESFVCGRSRIPSLKTILSGVKRTRSKRSLSRGEPSSSSSSSAQSSSRWRNLKILKLKNNRITQIDESISLAKNLEVLDLSYNKIRSNEISLECLSNLESLLLNFNSMATLSGLLSPSMTRLVQLSVSYNLLMSLEGLEGLTNLRELDASHNLIMFFENVGQLKSLKSLRKLEIAGNPMCLNKNYRTEVINKLHPAAVGQIALDGRRLTGKEKKFFLATLDTPENPIPIIGHEDLVASARSGNQRRRPIRIVEDIPDQTNFQDDDDFLLSNSFYEGEGGGQGHKTFNNNNNNNNNDHIVGHFVRTHENYRPNGLGGESQPEVRAAEEGPRRGASQDVEGKNHPSKEIEVSPWKGTRGKAPHATIESSIECSGGVQIEVEAVIEKSLSGEGRQEEKQKEEEVEREEKVEHEAEPIVGSIEEFCSLLDQTQDSSCYFDALESPCVERRVDRLFGSRPTLNLPGSSAEARVWSGAGQQVFVGMAPGEREELLRDLTSSSDDSEVHDASLRDFDVERRRKRRTSCVIRGHWLLVVLSDGLPRLEVMDHFDLRALKRVVEVGTGEVKVEFDTMRRDRRERTFDVDTAGNSKDGEFVKMLRRFVSREAEQRMLECLKCGHCFTDDRMTTSADSKQKWPLDQQKMQSCPQCSSTMVVEATKKKKKMTMKMMRTRTKSQEEELQEGSEARSFPGPSSVLSMISRQINKTDFGTIEDVLNKSLNCEMGYVDANRPSLHKSSSSGGFLQTKRTFIKRGIIGGDEDVVCFVDEEGQEAI